MVGDKISLVEPGDDSFYSPPGGRGVEPESCRTLQDELTESTTSSSYSSSRIAAVQCSQQALTPLQFAGGGGVPIYNPGLTRGWFSSIPMRRKTLFLVDIDETDPRSSAVGTLLTSTGAPTPISIALLHYKILV